ncbi:toprim domain-containing protein [Bradyrhizobium sp. F1.13.3]|uniref:DUF7146 domain-containing protein n=1 Tax=Bradyrhizobium sp. F1.13.3 TaxID=3156351 RepID=UPI0033940221
MNPLLRHIAEACGGAMRSSTGVLCRCPAHSDENPSLSLGYSADGVLLVHCFAGCDQLAVIDALKRLGLWPGMQAKAAKPAVAIAKVAVGTGTSRSAEWAATIWKNSFAAKGSLVETYLRRRGVTVTIPPAIRFHLGLQHPEGARWPTMVALVTGARGNTPMAIHRTFLSRDGTSKAAVATAKMMLGPCKGGIVRLGGQGGVLLIGEGIETCLSAMQATGHRTWAALSTSGLLNLDLPDNELDIVVLADADQAGEAAAGHAGRRWAREGRRVKIARPPQGVDFNDVLNAAAGWTQAQNLPRVQEATPRRSSYESALSWR